MKKNKTVFTCQACGYQALKWMGKCPDCGKWETFVEEVQMKKGRIGTRKNMGQPWTNPLPINAIEFDKEDRFVSHIAEFDRVLGGGLVPGTLVLIGGDPGIGKSTLMLQVLFGLSGEDRTVLYISGEESAKQIRIRGERLSTISDKILVVSEIDLDSILAILESTKPYAVVIDSIQTMFSPELSSAPGSVSQVRESAMRLMLMAKQTGIPVFLIGHVTKDGVIAGPRLLEHMVDTVLYFEGDRNHIFRILRAVKNRFGSTNEIGVFEMKEKGLKEVNNPSAIFLSERSVDTSGSVVTASIEGTRPILVELQALVSRSSYGTARRTILGLDQNRVSLLVAVMEKKLGMQLMGYDIFMNVAGGVKVEEPAVDMGMVSAIASSFLDQPILNKTIVLGEIGLTGEVRAVGQIESRIAETKKMGFTRCLIPQNNLDRIPKKLGIELIGVKNISEAIDALF